ITSTMALGSIIGPPVMSWVFVAFSDRSGINFPGAPYVLAALLLLIAAWKFIATARLAEAPR
ncbi:MAG: hypothetical protein K2Y20_15425, partial [Sphingomonas sp.]|nr:hypothetical protein [Sphingomonas sp.]